MGKHKSREEWVKLFKSYETEEWDWDSFLSTVTNINKNVAKRKGDARKAIQNKGNFINKYRQWKLMDNLFMNKTNNKKPRRNKKEREKIVDSLTTEELKDIANKYLEIKDKEEKTKVKSEAMSFSWSNSRKAYVFGLHRTTFYKKSVSRTYKFDIHNKDIKEVFDESKGIYGSRRIEQVLKTRGIEISDRSLRNQMNRLGLVTKTRIPKRKREVKDTKVRFDDLVKRNYNPISDNIVATDVSYISANVKQRNVYLSVCISHKTKLIESWELSKTNDSKLVLDTFKKLRRTDFIMHSDHGFQYSTLEAKKFMNTISGKISMSRVGNSLDNREVEYFFGCLKGEYLKYINTSKMDIEEIRRHISTYIDWYNTKRIQKRLQWKAPTEVSAYAI